MMSCATRDCSGDNAPMAKIFIQNSIRCFSCFLGALLLMASAAAPAFSKARPDGLTFSILITPRIFTVGMPRSIAIYGASGPVAFDESAITTTGTLVIRMTPEIIGLLAQPQVVTYTPRNSGTLRVILRLADGTSADAQMETVARGYSTVNLDGMWFDPATNGSGIAFNHSPGSDGVLGTWFMYGFGSWYSLQSMRWLEGGTSLVGIAYEATASAPGACVGNYCPRPAALSPVGTVSVSVVDQNNLRVETFDQYGRPAFVSLLKRLAF